MILLFLKTKKRTSLTLSIIIVNYNVSHYLQLCLDSVFAALDNISAEVIVVDNASVDDSVTMIETHFPEVHLTINDENLGFSKANNIGVAKASGDYVCILNPDTVVGENVFEEVYAFAKKQPQHGISSVRLVDGTGHFLPESKRNLPTAKVSLQKMLGNGSTYYANHLQEDQSGEVSILVGAFMFMKRALYREVGGFDERYFMYGEDIDLSYTVTQAGYKNYYLGTISVIHFKGESTIKDAKYRARFYGAMRLFYDKHIDNRGVEATLVNTGLFFARHLSGLLNRKKGTVKNILHNDEYFGLISQSTIIESAMLKYVSSNVKVLKKMRLVDNVTSYVFDASYIPYKKIIKEIITYRDSGVTFKITPKNVTFALGSNSSEGRGDVIHFNE